MKVSQSATTELRVGIVQMNPRVGDLEGNAGRILKESEWAAAQRADLLVFPELVVCGYPPEDLVLKFHFVDACRDAVYAIAQQIPEDLTVLLGCPWRGREKVVNAAVVIRAGHVEQVYAKQLLPNYGVFDEQRIFEAGQEAGLIDCKGWSIGLHICEDSWFDDSPAFERLAGQDLDMLINISASPFHWGKHEERSRIVSDAAKRLEAPVVYCNLVGGQDELVFDGRSLVSEYNGDVTALGPAHEEASLLTIWEQHRAKGGDADSGLRRRVEPESTGDTDLGPLDDVYRALVLGLRDYVEKNGFQRVLVAISGGVDSALVAALAVDALGSDHVVGVTMPSRFNSSETISDSERLADSLGIRLHCLPIQDLFEGYLSNLEGLWNGREPDATEENIQARIRGTLIMALSNKFGWLVLATGNKSEMATGYCTLYGDMAGGFAVIKDVPKTLVFDLCRYCNRDAERIPSSIIDRPPSAELRENQKDSDSLPPYEELDPILTAYVEEDLGLEEMIHRGFKATDVQRIIRLVDQNEYKRRQAPPGVKITPKAFGRDRRVPITNAYLNRGFGGIQR